MKLAVTLMRDETGMIVLECPAIPGCVSQGRTEAEALANIREAIGLPGGPGRRRDAPHLGDAVAPTADVGHQRL